MPAYNDVPTIARAVGEAAEVGAKLADEFEILVIDDGSKDGTVSELEKLAAQIPQLHFSVHAKNQGYGATIRELYYKGRFEWLFSVPGDYQIGANELLKFLPYTAKAEMIIGLRKHRRDSWKRLLQSRVYNGLLQVLFGLNIHDINSVRLMKSSMLKKIRLMTTSAFVDAELAIKAKKAGFRVVEVPIEHRARVGTGGGGKWYIIKPVIMDMVRFAVRQRL